MLQPHKVHACVAVSDISAWLSSANMSVCAWVNVSGVRLGDSRVARWPLTRMDGWMWTSLSRSFHSDWADSSVWDAVVISLVSCALQPLPLMDHSEPPSCLWLRLCVRTSRGHLRKCSSRCVYVCARASAVHKCAFVNTIGHPTSSTIVFFIETSGVFQKQVQKNKCRNVLSCCSCTLQMVPLCRRVPSSPCHLLFSPTNCLLSSFYLSPSFKRALIQCTHKPSSTHCFTLF